MIRLSGKEPDRDIRIEVVGARPGEKLHEELWTEDDHVVPSGHPAIMQLTRPPIDAAWLELELQELERLVVGGETLELVGRLAALVREPRRLESVEVSAAVTATPTSETV